MAGESDGNKRQQGSESIGSAVEASTGVGGVQDSEVMAVAHARGWWRSDPLYLAGLRRRRRLRAARVAPLQQ
jgi:hypothetical protein